jgi:GAF domain-containing protein
MLILHKTIDMDNQELERIKSVKRFEHFDFTLNNAIHGVLKIAADTYEAPAAFITLIGEDDQWFKVNHGFEVLKMPRETSFCTHTILMREPMVVSDALADDRFATNPLVVNTPNIRFYAGAALTDHQGQNIGTLCVMDAKPKVISEEKKQLLMILAKQAIHLMELEYNYQQLGERLNKAEQQNAALKDIAFIQSYEFRKPLGKIAELVSSIKAQDKDYPDGPLLMLESLVTEIGEKIDTIELSTEAARNAFIGM